MKFDANEIVNNLWQGAIPPQGIFLSNKFDLVIFAAKEYQPLRSSYPNIDIIYAPNYDNSKIEMDDIAINIANQAADLAASALRDNKKVLVTCHAGINRSGLIVALSIHKLFPDIPMTDIINIIRKKRTGALTNKLFVKYLLSL
jgi:protein-tyrosine phosphatase